MREKRGRRLSSSASVLVDFSADHRRTTTRTTSGQIFLRRGFSFADAVAAGPQSQPAATARRRRKWEANISKQLLPPRAALVRALFVLAVALYCAARGEGFVSLVSRQRSTLDTNLGRDRYVQGQSEGNAAWRRPPRSRRTRVEAASMAGAGLRPGRGTQVVLLRHGMSTFNKLNIFTGWCDVPLTEEGRAEAREAGKLLAAAGYRFDVAHASVLKRACTSLHRLLDGCGQPYIPIKTNWRLNERHYGALQGRNKQKLEDSMGDIVIEWRRGYGMRPPPMTESHPHFPIISLDSRYRGVDIPETESLRDTAKRVMEYWESDIVPDIRAGKRVLVVAHANTLRSLVKRLDSIEEDAIRDVNIPTGEPFVYDFDADLRPIGEPNESGFRGKFVGDMLREKDAAVDEYERREQACMQKWAENPEVVPEECFCAEDMDIEPSQVSGRFGDAQASLGLDRYSVGYDLPLPSFSTSASNGRSDGQIGAGEKVAIAEEAGGPVIDDAEAIEGLPGEFAVRGDLGVLSSSQRGEELNTIPDRNETSSLG